MGRADGLVVFCFGPLPGERATVRIAEVKRRFSVGEMQRLLVKSPLRADPFCPVFGACGGCQVQHLSYPAQLAWKQRVVRDALTRIGGFGETEVLAPIGMATPRAYRNKMSLVLDRDAKAPRLGFYRQRSHQIVPIDGCPVVMPQLNEYIPKLSAACVDPETAPAFAGVRHIVARGTRNGKAVLALTTVEPSNARSAGAALLKRLDGATGITNSYDLSGENAILGRKFEQIAGSSEVEEAIDGIRYRISAESFFQINVEITERIFDFLRPALADCGEVVDLYCGAGTFALFFAKYGCNVYGVEENARAVTEAERNAELNGFAERCRFRAGRTESVLRLPEARAALTSARAAFLDPPRKGSDEATLDALAAAEVPQLWYLSCDPATLARDLKFLAAKGYRIAAVQPFDMFPQTGHIETLVMLSREAAV